jgi:hypothetical protein
MQMPQSTVRQIRVMISSTRADLDQYRREALAIIARIANAKDVKNRIQLLPVSMEEETLSGDREFAVQVSKRWVSESDWVVLIVAFNYGTISDEPQAHGLSVTEWEYRHAVKPPAKKVFPFIAGEPNTANRYRYSQGEEEDLKDWISRQSPDQQNKLTAFKDELKKSHVEFFSSLQAFRERLDETLRNALQNLPPYIEPGTPLAGLFLAVRPALKPCLRKVTLVANCKLIHDHLHSLRQRVIRPLREEVLAVWTQEGTISKPREQLIWRCIARMWEQFGAIGEAIKSIGSEHQGLRDSVDNVLAWRDNWNISSDSLDFLLNRETFAERVDAFADDVQQAFSEADRSMSREESDLRELYKALRDSLARARQEAGLSPLDQQRLDEELETVDVRRSSVKDTLTLHHRWQEAHDKLEEVNGFREWDNFERKLKHYRGAALRKVLAMVDEELALASPRAGRTVESSEAAKKAQDASVTATADDRFVEGLRKLRTTLMALETDASVQRFDEMRKPFDDAFYAVDQRTLAEVVRARERADTLQEWVDGLATAQREAI